MKVFFDTNVLVDVLALRVPFFTDSQKAIDLAGFGQIDAFTSASVIKDIHYIISNRYRNAGDALDLISELLVVVHLADTTAQDVFNAIKSGNVDFEDAIISETAAREFADVIVTRNKSDFMKSSVPVLLPSELVEKFK